MNRMDLTLFIVEQEVLLSLDISSRGYLLRKRPCDQGGSASALMESREVKVLCLGEETDKSS